MSRPKRRAAPTVFIDDGTIPDDTSADERSLSNEEELLNKSNDDLCDSVTLSSEEEQPVAKTKTVSTTKAPVAKTTKPPVKKSAPLKEIEIAKPVKTVRTFKLLVNTIVPQGTSPKINVKKITILEYETATPIQAARKMGPTIYTAKIGQTIVNTVYVFDIQEVIPDIETEKTFSYICESTFTDGDVTHVIKPKTKKTEKSSVTKGVAPITKEKKEVSVKTYPPIEKKKVPTRVNVKQLTPKTTVKKVKK